MPIPTRGRETRGAQGRPSCDRLREALEQGPFRQVLRMPLHGDHPGRGCVGRLRCFDDAVVGPGDGVIEAAEPADTTAPWMVAVQWHPEDLTERALFEGFA